MRKVLLVLLCLLIPMQANAQSIGAAKLYERKTDAQYVAIYKEYSDGLKLQKLALAEAEGEGVIGMMYVIQTVHNRMESEQFPNDIDDVINECKGGVYQFSSVEDGRYEKSIPNEKSEKALELSKHIKDDGQLYFENNYGNLNTWHARNLDCIFTYRHHTFYK